MRAFLVLIFLSANVFAAGPVIFGARGGAAFIDNDSSLLGRLGTAALTRSYLIGPTLGVRLPLGFSVEGDALYKRQTLSLNEFIGLPAGLSGIGTHADSWEFPVMAKFAVGSSSIAPVVGAGVTFRHINNFGDVPTSLLASSTTGNSVGFVGGAGLRVQMGPVNITPELRYTRWNSGSLTQSLVDTVLGSQNQIQVLIGVTF
jgi:hypothetical protein